MAFSHILISVILILIVVTVAITEAEQFCSEATGLKNYSHCFQECVVLVDF